MSRACHLILSNSPSQKRHCGNLSKQRLSHRQGIKEYHCLDLREHCVPLPPLAEQSRIVTEIERQLSVIRQADNAVATSLTRAERLRQSVLKRAFSGKLVPQDPNDEPASALLERIRVEREAAQASVKPKKSARRRRTKAIPEKATCSRCSG